MQTLTYAQRRAVETTSFRTVAIAGPGSGKTRTLVERIIYLIQHGTSPNDIAAITFTNDAARELERRLEMKLGYCGTLHGFMLRLLQRHGSLVGYQGRVGVLDEEQATDLLNRCSSELSYKGTKKALNDAIARQDSLQGRMVTEAELVACHFFKILRKANLVTFDMALQVGLKLAGRVQTESFIFVDEFQDSCDLDAKIYEALPKRQIFYVGDPDQAIYSFRGGDVSNLMQLTTGTSAVILLEENFRSDREICEVADRLIRHNENRVHKRTIPVSSDPGLVDVFSFPAPDGELAWLSQTIREKGPSRCAVLLRTNVLVDQYSEYLSGIGLPVATKKRQRTPEDWKQAKNFVALLNDPENDLLAYWFLEAHHGPKKANQAKLEAMASGKSINQHGLNLPHASVQDVPNLMARVGTSRDSITRVEDAIKRLPEGATMVDLAMAMIESDQHTDEIGDGVTITTYHSAKGREWDVVFLPAFEQQIIPGSKKNQDIEEERRLAYVGITRAKHELFISFCDKRKPTFGGFKPEDVQPSQFLSEAGLCVPIS